MESVYLLKYNGLSAVKIGMTTIKDPMIRIKQYSTYAPLGYELLGIISCNDAWFLEMQIHEEFKHRRLNGEWFNLTVEEVNYILKKHKSLNSVNYIVDDFDYVFLTITKHKGERKILNMKEICELFKINKEKKRELGDFLKEKGMVYKNYKYYGTTKKGFLAIV